ncbi:Asp23/Gls24 family envelope stress response protein [Agreia sp. Leaf244]|uniref:Asp23/Gls24 family envelope stress response protein n=1 Tax=Agreia sp. Leaf244 TaxID=1736305 RepID=UPI000A600DE5|nr:Asp23/Gls24 family envelope stress response protein [Agreia sp. Leaf244]
MTDLDNERDDLDGHTIDELSDYLDRGRTPLDPSIEGSPGCRIALGSLERLRQISQSLVEVDAAAEAPRNDDWLGGILESIGREARAGRDIPLLPPSPRATLSVTEGAVRGLIRAAGDRAGGLIIGRCRLDGDVTVPGTPITVSIDASVFWGERIVETVDRAREAIYSALLKHTELTIASIDITVHDVYFAQVAEPDASEPTDASEPDASASTEGDAL